MILRMRVRGKGTGFTDKTAKPAVHTIPASAKPPNFYSSYPNVIFDENHVNLKIDRFPFLAQIIIQDIYIFYKSAISNKLIFFAACKLLSRKIMRDSNPSVGKALKGDNFRANFNALYTLIQARTLSVSNTYICLTHI